MSRIVQYFVSILYFLQIGLDNLLVDANPLSGDKVSPAQKGEFPFVVSLGAAPATCVGHHFCTGSLITRKHVLTAAHCVEVTNKTGWFKEPSKILVTVGSNDVTQGTKYKVQEWKTFVEWIAEKNITINNGAVLFHDVAVVTLMDYVTEDIKLPHLSNSNLKSLYGKNVVFAGWGRTNFNIRPRFLQRADLKILDRKTFLRNLNAIVRRSFNVYNFIYTIARPPISTGCGDSGGPIILNGDEIVGVHAGVCTDIDNPNHQNCHAAVKFYRKFIIDIIDSNCARRRSH